MVALSPLNQDRLSSAITRLKSFKTTPNISFSEYVRSFGFKEMPSAPIIGKVDRMAGTEDRKGKKNGWYIYYEMPASYGDGVIGIGHFGDWKTGINEFWCSHSVGGMSADERAEFEAKREQVKAEREAERIFMQESAREKASMIWDGGRDCADHEYINRKMIAPDLRQTDDGKLIIPVRYGDDIVSLQFIKADGEKRFLTGGQVKGGWWATNGDANKGVYVCEGMADAQTITDCTGALCYASFNVGNLYEIAQMAKGKHGSIVVIAGDDDTETAGNPGRTKAEQAADGLGLRVIFPAGYKDFSDMYLALGADALRDYLCPSAPLAVTNDASDVDNAVQPPSGALSEIFDYYNATSGNKQHGFAMQTALAICSIILGRSYATDFENYPSLFLLNVGKSGTGKEHPKTVVERVLSAAGMDYLIAGDGYTSAGAVFSALLDRPKHISIIDEFGRYLEAGRDMRGGNHNQREANTKLMESIGRAHSVMRPPTYSAMTLKKKDADEIKSRVVHNPAITLLTMTTPSTLFSSLDKGAIADGFFNRFLVSISDAQRDIRRHREPIAVPQSIIDWIGRVNARSCGVHISTERASPVVLMFDAGALEAQEFFQHYCVDMANKMERFGMEELCGRSNEMAMRIALIVALSRDSAAEVINRDDMEWSIEYVKGLLDGTINALKMNISGSDFEGWKKEILASLRAAGQDGVTRSDMHKRPPYSKYKTKDLNEILSALEDAELATSEISKTEGKGRPTVKWRAL